MARGWLGQDDEAIADYSEANRLGHDPARVFVNRGDAWMKKQDLNREIFDYTDSLRFDPNNVYAYVRRTMAWHRKNEPDKEIARLRSGHTARSQVEFHLRQSW